MLVKRRTETADFFGDAQIVHVLLLSLEDFLKNQTTGEKLVLYASASMNDMYKRDNKVKDETKITHTHTQIYIVVGWRELKRFV